MLDELMNHKVEKVIIPYRDRLSRVGFELFKYLFAKFRTEIVVISEVGSTKLDSEEVFREISQFISTLKTSEIKTIMVACYDRTVKTLWINRSNVLRDMLDRETWTESDALFYSYFNMFINVMSRMVIEIPHETVERSRNLISMTGLVSAVYGGVILAYTEGVLEYADLLERMADLSTFSGTFNIGPPRRIRKMLEYTKSVSIFSGRQ